MSAKGYLFSNWPEGCQATTTVFVFDGKAKVGTNETIFDRKLEKRTLRCFLEKHDSPVHTTNVPADWEVPEAGKLLQWLE